MKLLPRHNEIIGRTVIRRPPTSTIVRLDETKVTKFVLVDGVGPEAEAAGIKVGQIVISRELRNILLDGKFIPLIREDTVACIVTDAEPGEFFVQTDTGTDFVAFDSENAAKSAASTPRYDEAKAAE